MKTISWLAAVIFLFTTFGPAGAQIRCADRAEIVAALGKKYKEVGRFAGLSDRGVLLEIFASDDGTWTALASSPDGRACMLEAGKQWEVPPIVAPGDDS